jgi:hypothetical protein
MMNGSTLLTVEMIAVMVLMMGEMLIGGARMVLRRRKRPPQAD